MLNKGLTISAFPDSVRAFFMNEGCLRRISIVTIRAVISGLPICVSLSDCQPVTGHRTPAAVGASARAPPRPTRPQPEARYEARSSTDSRAPGCDSRGVS